MFRVKWRISILYKLITYLYKDCFIIIYMGIHKMLVVKEDTKERLDKEKLCSREPYNDVIDRLLNFKEGNQV